jgi:ABC-type phosphate transport system substrate-binding protein
MRHLTAGLCTLGTALAMLSQAVHAEDIVVIVNKANLNVVDPNFVQRVYLGAIKGWPDGMPVVVLDQPEDSAARDTFSTTVLRKSVPNVKAIWSQNIFTGKGLPPRAVSPDSVVKQAVAADPRAIGYIRLSQLDDSVKVLGR